MTTNVFESYFLKEDGTISIYSGLAFYLCFRLQVHRYDSETPFGEIQIGIILQRLICELFKMHEPRISIIEVFMSEAWYEFGPIFAEIFIDCLNDLFIGGRRAIE